MERSRFFIITTNEELIKDDPFAVAGTGNRSSPKKKGSSMSPFPYIINLYLYFLPIGMFGWHFGHSAKLNLST